MSNPHNKNNQRKLLRQFYQIYQQQEQGGDLRVVKQYEKRQKIQRNIHGNQDIRDNVGNNQQEIQKQQYMDASSRYLNNNKQQNGQNTHSRITHKQTKQQQKQTQQHQSKYTKYLQQAQSQASASAQSSNQQQDDNDNEQRQKMQRTMSTQIMQSKIAYWEQPTTLRLIQEKSERQQNSNSNSIQKYQIKQRNKCKTSNNHTQSINKNKKKLKIKQKQKQKQKNDQQVKKTGKNLIVSLKYGQQSSRTYHVGLKILNKQWNKLLNSIHLKK